MSSTPSDVYEAQRRAFLLDRGLCCLSGALVALMVGLSCLSGPAELGGDLLPPRAAPAPVASGAR